ncbi:S1 RNA-binding domain-containing protein [Candidatus Uhrbacteria bacterium]|nr:S1 RNA-binding domain-containing protein [Candidatus Uhrbacteria bacterium]
MGFFTKTIAKANPPADVTTTTVAPATAGPADLKTLLADKAYLKIPKSGDLVRGTIVGMGRNEVKVDLPGFRPGIIRGPELLDASGMTTGLKVGDEVEATVVDLENERGFVELSFRAAGHRKAWNVLEELRRSGTITPVRVLEANKGGLLIQLGNVQGFLPVSQLSPGNYPRISGGDRQKILEKLKTFVGKPLDAKVIDVDPKEEKLIVSEKAAWEERQGDVLAQYHTNDTIDGMVTALADFGVFVRFPVSDGEGAGSVPPADSYLEGLIHISELSWKRVEHPRDVVKIGERVRCQIINIEGSKIFLSLKRLTEDPWLQAAERYHVGQRVEGRVVKVQPFGLFVELDPEIHGLAHVSELGDPPPASPEDAAKAGDVRAFTIISIDAKEHRLGLSLKTATSASGTSESVSQEVEAAAGIPDAVATEQPAQTGEAAP